SNWYVRRCRERFWGPDMTQDKINAYMTLYTVLVTLSKLCAPFVPFMAEQIYQNLVAKIDAQAPESVHLSSFPESQKGLINKALEQNMEYLLNVVVAGRSARNSANIKNRQPLRAMYVRDERSLPEELVTLIKDELNVKNVVFTSDTREFTTYAFKPQLRTLGPKYGKLVPQIAKKLLELDGNEVMDGFDAGRMLEMDIDGTAIRLEKDDLLITAANKEGFFAASDGTLTVVLDGRLDDALIAEGFVRELVSKIQTMRKEIGLEVTDHIRLTIKGSAELEKVAASNAREIFADVLADSLEVGKSAGQTKEWDINGQSCVLGIEKA
ncbi:MAG TPA: DUF5915 domain-containing protein, partial [Clostridia bacterium]|nr:DUF5915 domain-containing protein [Clostridia bacterium]